MVETDSLELVCMATSKTWDVSYLGHAVEDLRHMLSSDRLLSISKIPRTCNSLSHELARFGMLEGRTQVWLG
jgi:hypothetical protein